MLLATTDLKENEFMKIQNQWLLYLAVIGYAVLPSSVGAQTAPDVASVFGKVSFTCNSRDCSIQQTLVGVPPGYSEARAFISGWQVRRIGTSGGPNEPLFLIRVGAGEGSLGYASSPTDYYDSNKGEFSLWVFGQLASSNTNWQDWELTVQYSVVFVKGQSKLTVVNGGCSGTADCGTSLIAAGGVPLNTEFAGFGLRGFMMTASGVPGGIRFGHLKADLSNWSINLTDATAAATCSMDDGTGAVAFDCEIGAVALAVSDLDADTVRASEFDKSSTNILATSDTYCTGNATNPPPAHPYSSAVGGATAFDLALGAPDLINTLSADYPDYGLDATWHQYHHTRQGLVASASSGSFTVRNQTLGICIK